MRAPLPPSSSLAESPPPSTLFGRRTFLRISAEQAERSRGHQRKRCGCNPGDFYRHPAHREPKHAGNTSALFKPSHDLLIANCCLIWTVIHVTRIPLSVVGFGWLVCVHLLYSGVVQRHHPLHFVQSGVSEWSYVIPSLCPFWRQKSTRKDTADSRSVSLNVLCITSRTGTPCFFSRWTRSCVRVRARVCVFVGAKQT